MLPIVKSLVSREEPPIAKRRSVLDVTDAAKHSCINNMGGKEFIVSIEMIADTLDNTCALCRQEIPNFLKHEQAAFTLGALLLPKVARHLLECDECTRAADMLWRTWYTQTHV